MALPEAKNIRDSQLVKLLSKHKLGEDKPFQLLQEAIKIAKEKKDAKTLITAADKLFELNELNPVKTRINLSQSHNFKHNVDYNKAKELNDEVKSDYEKQLKSESEEITGNVKEVECEKTLKEEGKHGKTLENEGKGQ